MLVDARGIVLDFLMTINIPQGISEAMLVLDANKLLLDEKEAELDQCIYALDPDAQFLFLCWQFISTVPMAWVCPKYDEGVVEFWFNFAAFLKSTDIHFKKDLINLDAEKEKRSIVWDVDISKLSPLEEMIKNYGIKINRL